MSHLLFVSRLQSKALKKRTNQPLYLEFGVSEETAPYLVTSTTSLMWINEPHPGPSVKAAIRTVGLGEFFREVIEQVVLMGTQMQWGNVHPLTLEGIKAAIDHVEFYELGPVELLIPRANKGEDPALEDPMMEAGDEDSEEPDLDTEEDELPPEVADLMSPEMRPLIEDLGVPFRPSSWVPDGTIVVVPKDRQYVGGVSRVTTKKIGGVVHNAARGIAVARGAAPDELAGSTLPDADAG